MTKIKTLKDRIIFDGHAESNQECETITLLCDNLAKSVDFKTIKYESGYAEFEKIGGIKSVKDLMFPPALGSLTINFDSNITQVVVVASQGTVTCTESGSSYDNSTYKFDYTPNPTFTVTLNSGYVIDTITVSDGDYGGSVTKTSDNTFTGSGICGGGDCTITITSKQGGASKQTIDVSTLSGWENLASGDHSITIKTKASGYLDSASSNAVTVSKAASGYSVVVTSTGYGVSIYDGTSSSGTLLGTIGDQDNTPKTVICTSGNLYLDSFNGNYTGANTVVSGGVSIVSEGSYTYNGTFSVIGDGTITVDPTCLIEGTQITLADGSTKAIEDITYDDELLVWNFYDGKFDRAKPTWIKVEEVASRYNLVKFSNGAEVGFVGAGGEKGYHRIFNKEAGAFTYTGNFKETPNGTTTFAEDCTYPTVISQEIIEKEVKFYNVITDKHYNLFANGILTSCKLSNKYRIENMKYVGDKLISEEEEVAYFKAKDKLRKRKQD